jgi:hypothetical protein
MRILCNILVVLFVTATAVGQQINPVPDYIFRNSMSVGRNAPTDTSAYFSIGPRFGATRGFMPPMVVDTATVTGTKRNGLLIYSIQRNSFLYWDSTGSRWSRIAANLDTLLLSTRAWRQKGDDSLAAIINTRTDTVNLLSTKAWRQKGIDSVAALSRVGGSGTINRHPKFTASGTIGDGSIADSSSSVRLTILSGGNIGVATAAPAYNLDVAGSLRNTTNAFFNTSSGESYFGTTSDNGDFRVQINGGVLQLTGTNFFNLLGGEFIIGTTDQGAYTFQVNGSIWSDGVTYLSPVNGEVRIGSTSTDYGVYKLQITGDSYFAGGIVTTANNIINGLNFGRGKGNDVGSIAFGRAALSNSTSGYQNNALGDQALQFTTTGNDNIGIGYFAGNSITSGSGNIFIGTSSGAATKNYNNNLAIGTEAGQVFINGNTNTFIGYRAGRSFNRGNNNVIIGSYIGPSDSTNNNVFIADGSGNIRIRVDSAGNTGIATSSPAYLLDVAGSLRNTTNAFFNTSSGESYFGTTSDAGAFRLQVNGVARASDGLATGAPAGGTAATWKLGIVVAGSYTAASNYLQVDVGGTLYYIGLVTPN